MLRAGEAVRGARGGFSLVELLVAAAIMGVSLFSIWLSLSSGRRQAHRLDVAVTAQYLAHSVIEQAVSRLAASDRRFFKLTTPPQELVLASARGDWKAPFLAVASPRRGVLDGGPYFDPATGPVLPPMNEEERRWWASFSYEVRPGFAIRTEDGGAEVPLDANGDGKPESDLASLEVEVFYTPPGGPEQRACRLTTLVAAPDRAPGATALAQP